MCHESCINFVKTLAVNDIEGKRVLDVGSYDVNGSAREHIETSGCAEYIGIDMREGPGVDEVCDVKNLVERFGSDSFDIVISTEMLEHVEKWQAAISNMKQVCKPGGLIMITTRSKGFSRHDYPGDYWRFEIEDMRAIFADCNIISLQSDPQVPGVFILAKRPVFDCEKVDLSGYEVMRVESE